MENRLLSDPVGALDHKFSIKLRHVSGPPQVQTPEASCFPSQYFHPKALDEAANTPCCDIDLKSTFGSKPGTRSDIKIADNLSPPMNAPFSASS